MGNDRYQEKPHFTDDRFVRLPMTALGRLRQFSRMKAVFHAMLSGIEQLVSGLSGRAAIGVTICWMSGIGRGSRIDSLSRVSQISLHLTTCSIKQMTALGRNESVELDRRRSTHSRR